MEEVVGMRFIRADNLVGAALIHVKTPLGNVKVVCTPVAVVSGSDIVVKTPEHHLRIALVHSARSETVGVRTPLRRTEPHVPIDIRIGCAFNGGLFGLVEETDGMGRSAKLLSATAVVGVHILHIADETVAHYHHRRAELRPATLHGARLEHAIVLLLGSHYLAGFIDVERKRLFAVDVLAGLHRFDGHIRMPVVGRCNADHVDIRVLDHITEIGVRRADICNLLFCIEIVHTLYTGGKTHLVAIADSRNTAHVCEAEKLTRQITSPQAVAYDSDRGLLSILESAYTFLCCRTSGKRRCSGGPEKEVSSVKVHFHYTPFMYCERLNQRKRRMNQLAWTYSFASSIVTGSPPRLAEISAASMKAMISRVSSGDTGATPVLKNLTISFTRG